MFSSGSSSGSKNIKLKKGTVTRVLNSASHHEGTWDSEGIRGYTVNGGE